VATHAAPGRHGADAPGVRIVRTAQRAVQGAPIAGVANQRADRARAEGTPGGVVDPRAAPRSRIGWSMATSGMS
jgi:hypothetical protein